MKKARNNDFIMNKDGSRIHADIFMRAIEYVNIIHDSEIIQFQIVQKEYEVFEVFFILDEEERSDEIMEEFLKYLEESSWNWKFEFHISERLFPNERTGKLAWFVTEVSM